MKHYWKKSRRFKADRLAQISQHLGQLLDAGFPLIPSLRLLAEQKVLKEEEVRQILLSLDKGKSLSESFVRLGFPALFVSFVRAAEEHGDMVFGLKQCEEYYTQQNHLQRDVSQALAYPLVVLVLVGFSFFFLMTIVVPRFTELYDTMGLDLPVYTQMVLAVHSRLPMVGMAGGALVPFIWLFRQFIRYSPARHRIWEERWRRLPILRSFYSLRFTHYLCVQLGSLLRSGMPLLQSVEIMEELSPWPSLGQSVGRIRAGLLKGQSFHHTVREEGDRFLPTLSRLTALGEESGRLDQSLLTLGKGTEQLIRERLKRWTKSLEPILIFVIGVLMAITVIALFLPMLHLVRAI